MGQRKLKKHLTIHWGGSLTGYIVFTLNKECAHVLSLLVCVCSVWVFIVWINRLTGLTTRPTLVLAVVTVSGHRSCTSVWEVRTPLTEDESLAFTSSQILSVTQVSAGGTRALGRWCVSTRGIWETQCWVRAVWSTVQSGVNCSLEKFTSSFSSESQGGVREAQSGCECCSMERSTASFSSEAQDEIWEALSVASGRTGRKFTHSNKLRWTTYVWP